MKKIIPTTVAALVAVSISGMVCAAEIIKTGTNPATTVIIPAGGAKGVKKGVHKNVKNHMKHKKSIVETATLQNNNSFPLA
jgi:hypothetical protein